MVLVFVGDVVGDAFGDDAGRNVERSGDGGSAGHVRDDWLAGEEAGDGEDASAKSKVGFSSLAVEFGVVDTDVRVRGGAIGEGFVFAAEAGEVRIMRIVTVEDDNFGIHAEEIGFGVEIGSFINIGETGRDEIGERSGINRKTIEGFGFE